MTTHATANLLLPRLASHAVSDGPPMDVVAVLGFLAAFVTLVAALHVREARAFMLMLAVGVAGLSLYGFLQGAWPLGIVNAFFSAAVIGKWRRRRNFSAPAVFVRAARPWVSESRMSRMFGSN